MVKKLSTRKLSGVSILKNRRGNLKLNVVLVVILVFVGILSSLLTFVSRGNYPFLAFHSHPMVHLRDFFNPLAPGDFAEKRIYKLVEWFSGHCHAIKS